MRGSRLALPLHIAVVDIHLMNKTHVGTVAGAFVICVITSTRACTAKSSAPKDWPHENSNRRLQRRHIQGDDRRRAGQLEDRLRRQHSGGAAGRREGAALAAAAGSALRLLRVVPDVSAALKQPQWWQPQQAPYSIAGKLDLAARRIMGGWPLFAALSSVAGAGAALSQRLGLGHTGVDNWRFKNRMVPESQVDAVAAALNIPRSHIPHRSRLHKAGDLIMSGLTFREAILRKRIGYQLSQALNVDRGTIWKNWTAHGIPKRRVEAVARALACDAKLLPVSQGPRCPPQSDEQKQRIKAYRQQPDVRARMAATARAQPRANGKFASKETRT